MSADRRPRGWRTGLVLPDTQFGYRMIDGELDPFHDEAALELALAIVAAEKPNLVVLLGDYLDLETFGRYRKFPESVQASVQAGVDRGGQFLEELRQIVPRADIRLLEGNHDARLPNALGDALEGSGASMLRPANKPSAWPALSVPSLLELERLRIEYVDGYPVGCTYIHDGLAAIHGRHVASRGSTAHKVLADELVSIFYGHIHRQETASRTFNNRGKATTITAHSPGCLCRIDGAVPGAVVGRSGRTGRPATHFQNWQQGVTVFRYHPQEHRHALEPILFDAGSAMHRGELFLAA